MKDFDAFTVEGRKLYNEQFEKLRLEDVDIRPEDARAAFEKAIDAIDVRDANRVNLITIRREIALDIMFPSTPSMSLPTAPQTRRFHSAAKIIDMIFEPEAAESAIGDLAEGFQRRAPKDSGHATRWLWAQVAWLTFNRALAVVRSVVRARAGK